MYDVLIEHFNSEHLSYFVIILRIVLYLFENQDIMIDGISIENFRSFHKTTINGFERINLFGGKNNVGKTSLLEAFFVGLEGNIIPISRFRKQQPESTKPDEYIFFNQNLNTPIKIKLHGMNKLFYQIEINDSYKIHTKIFDANIKEYLNGDLKPFENIWENLKISLIVDKNTQYPKQYILSSEFDKADKKGESDEILKAIQVIEPNIVEIKTYSDDPGMIYLRDKGKKQRIPLIYYGDAIQKIMRYIITIAAFQNENGSSTEGGKYLLIDEIENGLHYTVQEDFWEMLFKLAITYDIQIFAATHSREMIAAFDKTALKFDNGAAYFELYRHIKTNEITANKIRPEVLEYKLENDKPMRGE